MRLAQREFDAKATPLCPAHLTAPVLHRVLAHPPLEQHVWGGKGVGSQASAGVVIGFMLATCIWALPDMLCSPGCVQCRPASPAG